MTEHILFKNGATLAIPSITSYGGWVYRPDEARTTKEIARSLNKTFGRTTDMEPAETWIRQYFQNNLDKMGWPEIANVGAPNGMDWDPNVHGKGMFAAYKHDALSWQTLNLLIAKDRDDPSKVNITLHWTGLNIQNWYDDRTVPTSLNYRTPIRRESIQQNLWRRVKPEKAYQVAARFGHNPVSYARELLGKRFPIEFSPPLDWDQCEPTVARYGSQNASEYDVEPGVIIATDAEHVFWRNRKHAKKVLIESEQALRELALALEHHGVEARFQTSTSYSRNDEEYGKQFLDSAAFVIPASNDDENKLGHTFEFTHKGMEITCGYIDDDELWETMQKRHISGWMKEMKDALPTDTYEDYVHTPPND
jgi:hypothetical protein